MPACSRLDSAGDHAHTQLLALRHRECQIANRQRWLPACESDDFVADQREDCCFMTFRPLHDRVLVRRVEAEEKTAGGIIIPDTAKEKPQEGEIVAAGTGIRGEDGTITPLDVKAGDKILFGKWSGTEVKLDGEDLLIMKESDILGIVG
jgi:chaperonin GroES